jgi:hypothetical protein
MEGTGVTTDWLTSRLRLRERPPGVGFVFIDAGCT